MDFVWKILAHSTAPLVFEQEGSSVLFRDGRNVQRRRAANLPTGISMLLIHLSV